MFTCWQGYKSFYNTFNKDKFIRAENNETFVSVDELDTLISNIDNIL